MPAPSRTLWLLRHAKTETDPPPGGTDFDRVLAARGRRDATALGRLFAGGTEKLDVPRSVHLPAVVLVSPAARTAATADLVLAKLSSPPEVRPEKVLYNAEPEEVLEQLHSLEDDVDSAMVVGHNPTAHELSQSLIAPGDKKGLGLVARRGFPTCALGIYRFRVERWCDVGFYEAKLVALLVPPFGGR